MKNIAIYGAGGFGRETALMIQQVNEANPSWNIKGFFDDGMEKGIRVDGLTVIGGLSDVGSYTGAMVVAVADPAIRKKIVSKLSEKTIEFPSLIHPSAQLGSVEFNVIEQGCIITAGVVMTTHITLDKFCIINLTSTIGHDVTIGAYSTIMPGCSISGNARIGEGCLLGTGSRTLQNIEIGNHSVIGAGAVVTKTCSEHSKLIGVPAREMKPQ